jgi:hypothetical protein
MAALAGRRSTGEAAKPLARGRLKLRRWNGEPSHWAVNAPAVTRPRDSIQSPAVGLAVVLDATIAVPKPQPPLSARILSA